jgi:excinuclease ABC subunit C
MIARSIKLQLQEAPLTSGVYLMRDKNGRVIYVGKAVSLRKRLQSYFRESPGRARSKTDFLVPEIDRFDCILTHSEAEALILEASLIKKFHPKYNVELRDDKSYPLIEVTTEDFPRVRIVRPRDKNPRSTYFGPYINSRLIREALTILRRIFPFCTCEAFPEKACLDFHIGLCEGPCVGSSSRKNYRKNIRNIRLILAGKKDQMLKELQKEMAKLARGKDFEAAAKVRDQLRALGALFSGTKDINYYKEAEQLQRALGLSKRPERIEAFDVSNIMGNQSVGSMVSFFNGSPNKSNYRRFRIKDVPGIDDVRMMAELIRRRYRRLKAAQALFPDLIVVDGGKGQLSAACEELARLEVVIPIIALAKREEEVYMPRKKEAVILSKDSLGLRLLQRIRDEAHRFAVAYHRKLRAKDVFRA